jgi:hypothetical protein
MAVADCIDERTGAMKDMYDAGATLQEVGARFGVTRQAVEQRFRRFAIPMRTKSEAAALKREKAASDAAVLRADIRRRIADGESAKEIATRLGATTAEIRRQCGTPEVGGRRIHRGGVAIAYSDEELLAPLRCLGTQLGKAPGVERYRSFRREHGGVPDAGTILKRFGTWSAAVQAAGFTPNDRPASARMGARVISDEEIRCELWRVASIVGHAPSYSEYAALARRPSPGAIRLRHGGWTAALKAHFCSTADSGGVLGRVGCACQLPRPLADRDSYGQRGTGDLR